MDKYLAPLEVQARMRLLWSQHEEFLHFIWGRAMTVQAPKALQTLSRTRTQESGEAWRLFFVHTLLVPPNRFRPPQDMGDMVTEHQQNLNLSKVLTLNEKIQKLMRPGADAASLARAEGTVESLVDPSIDMSSLVSSWIDLQNSVNIFIDSAKDPNPLGAQDNSGIRQILERKEGLFRRHMMGKRVNYCCRSVISPDPYIGTNEIGIPVLFAKTLHFPTPVTSWNAKLMRQLVENGPNIYPGKIYNRC